MPPCILIQELMFINEKGVFVLGLCGWLIGSFNWKNHENSVVILMLLLQCCPGRFILTLIIVSYYNSMTFLGSETNYEEDLLNEGFPQKDNSAQSLKSSFKVVLEGFFKQCCHITIIATVMSCCFHIHMHI